EIEFLIPQRSNSGIKLMGLYEVQITDSHGKSKMTGSECGGIYPRAELLPKYRHLDEGIAPKSNACGKPGEWQKLELAFRAAKHEGEGKDRKKIANARFDRVVLNGTVIHENLEVSSPTGHNWTKVEPAKGPLMLQLDHGPVAVRKFMARDLGK
ncbi:MAG: 3-keto-disaccharide hydrolase, partial [Gemmataceae bacterium]